MSFLDADYAAIEARIVCWLAGQEDALEEYRQGVDRYKRMASVIYGVPEDQVNKHPQRFVGKQATLGCIAKGQLVLTDHGEIPIEKVCSWHQLWDGVEWVHHEGLVYQGHKEVITYQGLTATPDHIVFTGVEFQRTTDLRTAREQELRLTVSGEERAPVWPVDSPLGQSIPLARWVSLHEGDLRVRNNDFSGFPNTSKRTNTWVRPVRSFRPETPTGTCVVARSNERGQRQMHQPTIQGIRMVWGQRNRVSVQQFCAGGELDHGQPWAEKAPDSRSPKQRGTLRAGEHEVCHPEGTNPQHPHPQNRFHLHRGAMALHGTSGLEISEARVHQRANPEPSVGRGIRETEEMESDSGKVVATYDILNAGPRHRFTVSGKLVHNCGYGMGPAKFRLTCKKMGGYDLPEGIEDKAVSAFRKVHKKVVQLWRDLEKAALAAIIHKGEIQKVGPHLMFKYRDVEGIPFLFMRLPSGRKLAYPRPKIVPGKFEGTTAVSYFTNTKGTKWGHISTWGGTWCEQSCQAVAADVMAAGVHQTEARGYETATLIHDQCLSYYHPERGQTAEEFVKLLTTMPAWADGLPLEASGEIIPFYKKDI